MKRDELTTDERIRYMPVWEKIVIAVFFFLLPIIGSIVNFQL